MSPQDRPVVVITGGSAGLGRATAQVFARHGWKVGLIARGEDRLEDARREVGFLGGEGLAIPCDVADAPAVDRAAERVERELGPIDVWINGAMLTVFSPVSEMTAEDYRAVTETTYLGQVHGTLAALRHMRPRDRGTIVCAGSALAYRGIPLQSAYCASKFAVRGFFESLRSELIHEGSAVRLSMVQLPAMNTPQFNWARARLENKPQPVPPIFEPEPCAHALYRAATQGPRELWVGGSSIKTILGAALVPGGWLDRQAAKMGYDAQLRGERLDPHRPDNLEGPAPGHQAAHGAFDKQARWDAVVVDPDRAKTAAGGLLGGALALGLGYLVAAALRRPRPRRDRWLAEVKGLRKQARRRMGAWR